MGNVTVHDGPHLNWIEMWAIGRQLDQMNATVFARQERSDVGAIVVWGIVPNDVNDTFVRVSGLDFGEKMNGADTIDGGWFNEGRDEGFQVQSPVNVDAPAPRCWSCHCLVPVSFEQCLLRRRYGMAKRYTDAFRLDWCGSPRLVDYAAPTFIRFRGWAFDAEQMGPTA